ncbi:MAG: LysR family transcriptional regulator [Myxococcota bacterium]
MGDGVLENWDDLRYFLCLVEHGSVSATARALRVDPTTVTRRVAVFEDRLGKRLFDRLRGGVILSPDGELLLKAARPVEDGVHDLERVMSQNETDVRGSVRVAIAELLALCWTQQLGALAERHALLHLQIVAGDAMHDLTRREADVAVRVVQEPSPHLVGRKISMLSVSVYGAPNIAARGIEEAPWLGWVGLDEGEGQSQRIRTLLGARGPTSLRVNAYGLYLEHARRGSGLAVLPRALGDPDPRLKRMPDPDWSHDLPLWVLTHPDLRGAPRIRVVMDAIAQFAQAGPPEHFPPLRS